MDSTQKFTSARQRLSTALKSLEEVMQDKIKQIQEEKVTFASNGNNSQVTINNLSKEINTLQQSLGEIGAQNDNFIKNASNLKKGGIEIMSNIKLDLDKIKLIINADN